MCVRSIAKTSRNWGGADNIGLGALHDREKFSLLLRRHAELVERVLKVLAEGDPFRLGDLEVDGRIGHYTARIFLGPAGRPTDHLGHEVLKPRLSNPMMGLVDQRIRVQGWVDHDAVDEIVDHGGDSVDAAKAVVERWCGVVCAHGPSSLTRILGADWRGGTASQWCSDD